MRFKVEHVFRNISLTEYEQLYFDEAFNEALCAAVKLARSVVSLERDDTSIKRVVKVGPDRELPGPVAKVLKSDRIEYEEHLEYTFGTYHGTWETIPSLMSNKVDTRGTFSFAEKGSDVRRVVEGAITVKILGVGGLIEKFIVADVERSYNDAARVTQTWIDEGKHR